MTRTFTLDASDMRRLNEWLAEHDKTCVHANPLRQGAAGGRLTYEFAPTSLGMVTKVECACGGACDLTDWDM